MNYVTLIGITIIFYYCMSKILSFYGVSPDTYNMYFYFYVFLILSLLILPKKYSTP